MERLLGNENRSYLMGFSILWIIGLHFYMYSAFPENSVWHFLFGHGYLGVDVFLFLSAYGLCFSYNSNRLVEFYKRRLTRIYPVYLLFLIVVIWLYGNTYSETPVQLFVYQSTGLASFRQTDFEWYIPALIIVYATFPLLFKGVSALFDHCRPTVILLPLLLSFCSPIMSKVIFPMFATRLTIIVLGIITYLCLRNNEETYLYKTFALCAVYAILTRRPSGVDFSLIIPGVLCLISLSNISFPFNKCISFFGRHSLEIYLAQSLALNQFFLKSDMTYSLKCLVALLIIVVGSFVLYWFQALFMKLIRN